MFSTSAQICIFSFASAQPGPALQDDPDMKEKGASLRSGFLPLYSCDNAVECQQLAASWKSMLPKPSCHHFQDIFDRIPSSMKSQLDTLLMAMPKKVPGMSKVDAAAAQEQREQIYLQMQRYMLQNSAAAFTSDMRSQCSVHHRECPIGTLRQPGMPDGALSMGAIGNTCVAFTPFGKREGAGHESMTVLITWAAHWRFLRPVVILEECHCDFPPGFLQWWFDDLYHLDRMEPHPSHIGMPLQRPRGWIWLVRLDFELQGSCDDFLRKSKRTVEVNGDEFFLAPESAVEAEFHRLVKLRHLSAHEGNFADKDCAFLLVQI